MADYKKNTYETWNKIFSKLCNKFAPLHPCSASRNFFVYTSEISLYNGRIYFTKGEILSHYVSYSSKIVYNLVTKKSHVNLILLLNIPQSWNSVKKPLKWVKFQQFWLELWILINLRIATISKQITLLPHCWCSSIFLLDTTTCSNDEMLLIVQLGPRSKSKSYS